MASSSLYNSTPILHVPSLRYSIPSHSVLRHLTMPFHGIYTSSYLDACAYVISLIEATPESMSVVTERMLMTGWRGIVQVQICWLVVMRCSWRISDYCRRQCLCFYISKDLLGMSSCSAILLVLTQQRRREKAIKDLLTRQAMKLDDWTMRGFCGSLKIPTSWVNEAKVRFDPMLHGLQCPYKLTMDSQAIYALDKGEVYQAYESYLTAQLY